MYYLPYCVNGPSFLIKQLLLVGKFSMELSYVGLFFILFSLQVNASCERDLLRQLGESKPRTAGERLVLVEEMDDAHQDLRREIDPKKKKKKSKFRDYENAPEHVKAFYREQHEKQTYDYARRQKELYENSPYGITMGLGEAIETYGGLVDKSDPDAKISQIDHFYQTAEGLRKAEAPDWMQLVGLQHDLGKSTAAWGEPQWAVVGDTFPVGMPFSREIVYNQNGDHFYKNPDLKNPDYQKPFGIYGPGIGLDKVTMSWGHDEYMYMIARDNSTLPPEALDVLRYHSFYPLHMAGAYTELLDAKDWKSLPWIQKFQTFDLYTKSDDRPNPEELAPYYEKLINQFYPPHEGETERQIFWPTPWPIDKSELAVGE